MIGVWLFKDLLWTDRRQKVWNMIKRKSERCLGKALDISRHQFAWMKQEK
jgi:hypothetical protein